MRIAAVVLALGLALIPSAARAAAVTARVTDYAVWLFLPPEGGVGALSAGEGAVFLTVRVEVAAAIGADYSPADWVVTADEGPAEPMEAVAADYTPRPQLGSGRLAAGQRAQGWLMWRILSNTSSTVRHVPSGHEARLTIPYSDPS